MGAPKGNQFWKLRSKHGRDTLFADAVALWEAAQEYFDWCDKHPWKKKEAIKSGDMAGKTMNVPTQRPYTLSGFMVYCGASEAYWRTFKGTEAGKRKDFLSVISAIEEVIRTQQVEGASVGAFNANIISRLLGLTDRHQHEVVPPDKPDWMKYAQGEDGVAEEGAAGDE
jgi:hypothetical protein